MHEGQLEISLQTVRRLVDDQFPQWRDLALSAVASDGTVNALFRLGDDLSLRFPVQPGDPHEIADWLAREAAATNALADAVTLQAPRSVAIGHPSPDHPLPWAVQTWVDGEVLTSVDLSSSLDLGGDLAHLIGELRAVPVGDRTFSGTGRGGLITAHDDWIETCLTKSDGLLDVATARVLWHRYRTLPHDPRLAMTHADLMPGNLLAVDGRLSGVIDCGGFAPTDPALDLVAAWHLVESDPREVLRRGLGSSDLEWTRGQAWAFVQSMGLVWYYATSNPVMAEIGRRTLDRIMAEPLV